MDTVKNVELSKLIYDAITNYVFGIEDEPDWAYLIKDEELNPIWEVYREDDLVVAYDAIGDMPPLEFNCGTEMYYFILDVLKHEDSLPKPDPDNLIPF